ncbi:uncharacterized protein LOC127256692 isoform X2 [Andrographis paniculata]|uniref:uncharacterized protein LOC127256692 isoform X2 n=1 Tax=Andrographis paniculata TaxID=175694 RepID=UPI0021E8C412|nr:uncharacterized protein LOC127256692 isoform X2 [Andrographis paniculata]
MLKRQDSLLSSSRRQGAATPPPESHNGKAVGCMSGILRLFSKYQNANRRLTLGRKHEKRRMSSSSTNAKRSSETEDENSRILISETDRVICDLKLPRSPTIQAEIRRSSSTEDSRTPSSLVAKLMGLEDIRGVAANSSSFDSEEDRISKKRKRLLKALEKCNEDLEVLKKIIKALQTGDMSPDQPPRGHSGGGNTDPMEIKSTVECTERIAAARDIPACAAAPGGGFYAALRTNAERKPIAAKKPGEEDDELPIKRSTFSGATTMHERSATSAMVKSVAQVCGDIAWGERRERDRIGVSLQEQVYRELIEELVEDIVTLMVKKNKNKKNNTESSYYNNNNYSYSSHSLPLEVCKKRLCF